MTEGTTPPAPKPGAALVGQTLAGRYRILGLLGEGAMGSVYVGEHMRMGRRDAIKVLQKSLAQDEEAIARFIRGAKNASRVRHPNVCSIYDCAETEEGLVFVAMEFIDGESLHELLAREKALPLTQAAQIVKQTADALQAAHEAGIVHRDLKPANIMLTRGRGGAQVVKVVDFDIAKGSSEGESSDLTQVGFVIGTPEYMSPEQLTADSLDGRSDVYSLGMVLFRMLTGLLPFASSTSREAMVQRLTTAPRTLATVAPDRDFPPAVQRVLDRALARAPEDRFPDADAFAEALLDAVQGPSAPPAPAAAPEAPPFPPPDTQPRPSPPDPLPPGPGEEPGEAVPATQVSWGRRKKAKSRARWLVPAGIGVAAVIGLWVGLVGGEGEGPILDLLPEAAAVRSGEVIRISATLSNAREGDTPGSQVEWSSSDLSVATVSESGQVTGIAPGTASIVARLGELTATSRVTVSPADEGVVASQPPAARPTPPATVETRTREASNPSDEGRARSEPTVEDRQPTTPDPVVEDTRPSSTPVGPPPGIAPGDSEAILDRQVNRLLDDDSPAALRAIRDTTQLIWALDGVAPALRAQAAFVMAQAQFAAGDTGQAILWAERAVQLAPGNDGYRRLLETLRGSSSS